MIENLCQKARSLCGDQELIRLELTAGMDSRAVAAILLSVIGPSRMEAQTSGSPDHYEVKTARRICRHYGIRHKDYAPTANQSGTFLEHSRLIAFFSNGMGNSKGAFRGLPKLRIQRPPIFIGNGGEVFRGFYYPSPLRTPILSNMDIDSVASCLAKKVLTRPGPAWLDPEIPKQLNKRLEEAVGNCARISDFPADIFTLFYLRERYRLWGGLSTRVPWTRAVAPCLTAQAW
ncbi:MAG: hypothetical protein JW828_06175 [Sedimentisphaerales bacterium]|nr:hypothetical protein [Sedimentisphaerales bacterium]